MSGVQIPSFTTTDETGVTWVALWDESGKISYSGKDKNGNSINTTPPASIIKKARDYGASFNNEKEPSPYEKKQEKTDKENKSDTPKTRENPVINSLVKKYPNLSCVMYNSENNTISFKPNSLNKIIGDEISKEDTESICSYFQQFEKTGFTNDRPRGLINKFKANAKSLGKGFIVDIKHSNYQAWNHLKQLGKLPIRMASDFYKTFKLISQGKFRELRDRAALRVHDNLEALGILSDNLQQRIDTANKRIEARLGIKDRTKNPNYLANFYGRQVRDVKALFNRLRGRDENSQKLKPSTVGINSNNKGISR